MNRQTYNAPALRTGPLETGLALTGAWEAPVAVLRGTHTGAAYLYWCQAGEHFVNDMMDLRTFYRRDVDGDRRELRACVRHWNTAERRGYQR